MSSHEQPSQKSTAVCYASRIAEALETLTVARALACLREAGAPAVPALTVDQTYTDEFLRENDYYESYLDPAFGPAHGPRCIARFTRTGAGFRRAAPMLGEHSSEVLRDFDLPLG